MSTVMKASEFVKRLKDVAQNYKTLYVMGCFGAPLTVANKTRYCQNNDYNKQAARTKLIQAASTDTFGFDCVCLIKGILWGWTGDKSKIYGGASYKTNGVPDISADQMIKVCSGVTSDFSGIAVGEAVWCTGHIGVYIGDGLAVECSPAWKNQVQITAVGNIGSKSGYNSRKWTKHGKLPYIDYDVSTASTATTYTTAKVTGTVSTGVTSDEKTIWSYLFSKIGNAYGAAGLMGNLYAESALRSNNLQNSYETKLGYTDATYTSAVDSGKYANFSKDSAGYGLAQWTYNTRKAALLAYAKGQGKSIGDLTMQLEFLLKELTDSYPAVLSALKSATSVKSASDVVLTKFECPASQTTSVKNTRASYGQKYYDAYAGTKTTSTTTAASTSTKVDSAQKYDKSIAGSYKVTANALHIRAGAGTGKTSLGILKNSELVSNYGYYTEASGVKWLYVKTSSGIIGFCSSQYLSKC